MAFNNYPYGYQQPQYYPQVQQQNYQSVNNSPLTWVQGEAGAKSYLVAPNTTVPLWDSEAQVIYLKSADSAGIPSIKVLDYTIRNEQPHSESYVTKDVFDTLRKDIDDLKARIDGLDKE